jgi:hypothetical protein
MANLNDLIKLVKELDPKFKIARVIVWDSSTDYIVNVGEFNIKDSILKSGKFAAHIRKFLNEFPVDDSIRYEVEGLSGRWERD